MEALEESKLNVTKPDLAWLAGFWDGEGTFGVMLGHYRGNRQFIPYASIVNTDYGVLQEVVYITDGTITKSHVKGGNRKEAYRVRFTGRKAIPVANLLLPYLRLKRQQAEIITTWPFRDSIAGIIDRTIVHDQQEDIYKEMKFLNHRGIKAGDDLLLLGD